MISIFRIEVTPDYETTERAGVSPLFQIASIDGYSENDEQINLLGFIDQGCFYNNGNEVLRHLKENCSEYSFIDCEIEFVS